MTYFTPETFQQTLRHLGFNFLHFKNYLYANENSLVCIVNQTKDDGHVFENREIARATTELATRYSNNFEAYRILITNQLKRLSSSGVKCAMFGAGHLTCAWLNFLHAENYISFVADDHPRKAGLFMPGSRLPILPSRELTERGIRLCLTGLSPESEAKVMANQQSFINAGGRFVTIFPGRPNSFENTCES